MKTSITISNIAMCGVNKKFNVLMV